MNLRDRLGAFGQLHGARELGLFAYVTAFASTVPLVMRLPLPRASALLTRGRARSARVTPERLNQLTRLAPRLAHPLVKTGCLTRGVTLYWFLRRGGVDVELRFGVDPRTDDAHCWLTLDGEPYLERESPARYLETYRLPA